MMKARKLSITALLLFCLASSGATFTDPRTNREAFWTYFSHPYPVSAVVFARPGREVVSQGNRLDGWLFYEGALHPDTYFLRHIADMSGQPSKHIAKGDVSGMSGGGVTWSIDRGAARGVGGNIIVSEERNLAAKNRADQKASGALRELKSVTSFGLGHLVYGTVTHSGDSFKARLFDETWPVSTNTFEVTGKIMEWEQNLPRKMTLTSPALGSSIKSIILSYEYGSKDPLRWYPTEFSGEIVNNFGFARHFITRKILSISFDSDSPAEGFTPSGFMTNRPTTRAAIMVATNNEIYWVNGNILEKLREETRTGKTRLPKFLISVCVASLIVGAIGARIVLIRKKRGKLQL